MALIFNLLCLAIAAENLVGTSATNYCKIKTCADKNAVQTMCLFPSPAPGPNCLGPGTSFGLTAEEKNAVVKIHNELRQKVASGNENGGLDGRLPPAKSMPNLVWDTELEAIAQKWANQCTFAHDACRDVERFKVGQNAAIALSSGRDQSSLVEMTRQWYGEVKDFRNKYISSFPSDPSILKKIGHFTQVAWAKSVNIGCGRAIYKTPEGYTASLFICNYGPGGNVYGAKVYEIKQ